MTDRDAFEAWHLVQFPKCPAMVQMKNPDGDYVYIATEWAAWQAATLAERERCAKVCEAEYDKLSLPAALGAMNCAASIRNDYCVDLTHNQRSSAIRKG